MGSSSGKLDRHLALLKWASMRQESAIRDLRLVVGAGVEEGRDELVSIGLRMQSCLDDLSLLIDSVNPSPRDRQPTLMSTQFD